MTAGPQPSRRGAVEAFLVMDVMRAANKAQAAGNAVVHMEVGQPGASAPAAARQAARAALDGDRLGYTDALGLPDLRARIARHYDQAYGVAVEAKRVVVTTGSSAGFILAFLAVFDAGARVAIADPGYPAYRNIMAALGIEPVGMGVGPECRWQPTAPMLEAVMAGGSLDGLLIASPANPTGTMLRAAELQAIAGHCARHDMWLISDEIYHGLTYETPGITALRFNDDAIVINSFSKYYAMTGWRVGWMVVPERLVRVVERLAQNLFISAPTLSQIAALAAFDATEELEANRRAYQRNRDHLLAELGRSGALQFAPADGAFYLYADVRRLTNDTVAFTKEMLRDIGVAATPGVDFDRQNGHHFVRFSFAGEHAEMVAAAERFNRWISAP